MKGKRGEERARHFVRFCNNPFIGRAIKEAKRAEECAIRTRTEADFLPNICITSGGPRSD